MSPPPANPKIYHITHVTNLPQIITDGELYSDAAMAARGGPPAPIGISAIKQRRLQLPVECRPESRVGEYVPFNFCPRSVMLYIFFMNNHPELTYRGGQAPIIHLQADLTTSINWADANARMWAFGMGNAGTRYTHFECDRGSLDQIDWDAVANNNFRDADVKEGKQAEFLMHDAFPWGLIEKIGVSSQTVSLQVQAALQNVVNPPPLEIRSDWYF